jgi:hypothetical protein
MKAADISTPSSPKMKETHRREAWIDLYFAESLGDMKLITPTGRDPKIIEAE